MNQITIPEWVSVKSETREKIRSLFGISKSSSSQVESDPFGKSRVISDGCTHADLQGITNEKMITYLGGAVDTDTIHTLFEKVVTNIESPNNPLPQATTAPQEAVKDQGITTYKCEFCEYANSNKRALAMHKIGKHRNR